MDQTIDGLLETHTFVVLKVALSVPLLESVWLYISKDEGGQTSDYSIIILILLYGNLFGSLYKACMASKIESVELGFGFSFSFSLIQVIRFDVLLRSVLDMPYQHDVFGSLFALP